MESRTNPFGIRIEATYARCGLRVPRLLAPVLLALALAATPAAAVINVSCAPNGSVTLSNPNPPLLGSTVTAVPTFGVIEQSINGGQFLVKKVGDPISWAANSIVNYRNVNGAVPMDNFSIGGFAFHVTIQAGAPPTPTTTTTNDVTITYSANDQAIGVSAHVTPTPPSGTITFSIPGAGSNATAVVNAQGNASGNFVVKGGTPSGNYPITATFTGPANYASSSGQAILHINYFISATAPANVVTTYSPAVNAVGVTAAVTSPFGGTVNVGMVKFTVWQGANIVGIPVSTPVVNGSSGAGYPLPAGLPAGTYSITAEYGGGGNFLPSNGQATLTVQKANQAINFAPIGTIPYGTPPFSLSATGGGSGNPIVFSVVSGFGSLQGNVLTVTGIGLLHVDASQAGDANYNPGYAAQVATVTPAQVTVTALPQTRPYGAQNPPLTFTATGLVNGDTIATAFSGELTTAPPSAPVGTYPINPGTLSAANYAMTFVAGTLTVTKAPLTVTADTLSKVTGKPNPPLTYSLAGFVNGDDEGVLSGTPALSTVAQLDSPPADYPIDIAAGTFTAANYAFSFVAGVLHVVVVPGSKVNAVDSAGCDDTSLTVHWQRTDGGTGEVTYSVFVSANGGPYQGIVFDTKNTSMPFSGTVGTTYGFYSQLKDQYGHVEDPPAVPDFTFTIDSCSTTTSSTTTSTSTTTGSSSSTSTTSASTSSTSTTGASSTSSTSAGSSSTSSTTAQTSTSTTSSTTPAGTADLAVTRIRSRRSVRIVPPTPRSVRVKVQVENRGAQADVVPDAAALSDVVHLAVGSLDAGCGTPATSLHLGKLAQKFPLTLEPRRRLQVMFDVTIDCANDGARGAGHEDFGLVAWVDHQAIGGPDAHVADDECPRAPGLPGEFEPFILAGTMLDKGCGGRSAAGTLGAPVLLDVVTD